MYIFQIVYKLIDIAYLEYCAIKQVQSSDAYFQQHTINQYIHLNLYDQPPKRIDYLNLGILFNEILTGVARRIDQIQSWYVVILDTNLQCSTLHRKI